MKRFVVLPLLILILVLGVISTAQAITNGQPDGDGHPYVGALVQRVSTGGIALVCSGSAISPKLFMTAAHCFPDKKDGDKVLVTFAPDLRRVTDKDILEGTWKPHPDFATGNNCGKGEIAGSFCADVAAVVFKKPVELPRYASLPEKGLVDTLANNTEIELVGYGDKEFSPFNDPPKPLPSPLRLLANATLIPSEHLISDDFVKVRQQSGKDEGGFCFGDSGGPNLLKGTDTIVGTNSFVLDGPKCDGVGYIQRSDTDEVLNFLKQLMKK
jgi:hypothetical protein